MTFRAGRHILKLRGFALNFGSNFARDEQAARLRDELDRLQELTKGA
jgi:hypothetical protein